LERLRVRQEQSAPLLAALEAWLREEHSRLSRSASVAQPIDYMLKRWDRFARFIEDGRVCLTNNAAERALRGFALGRKSWLFAGSKLREVDEGEMRWRRHRPVVVAADEYRALNAFRHRIIDVRRRLLS
jgi:hypothetical protein